MRSLVTKLLALLLAMPSLAFALGLGDIKLNSALNQPLDAEIELLSVAPGEAVNIDVSLASYDAFTRANIERPAVLMFLNFEVEKRADGSYYIHVHSKKEPIREPFLDFLVEVNWRTGRMLREYTVLLDPPHMVRQQAASAVTAPTTVAKPAASVQPPPPSAPVSSAPAEAPGRVVAQPMAPAAPAAGGALTYGPVKANDTLWSIAREMRPSARVSPQQMMMALLKANPEAFYDNNVNRLKKGYVLRIDDQSLITAMSKAEAAREVSRQMRSWEDYKQGLAAGADEAVPPAEAAPTRAVARKEESSLKLVAPKGEEAAAEEMAAPGTDLKGDAGADELRQELMLAQETFEAQRRENDELKGRLQELEGQLASMQRLLELKDSDLAVLQRQLRGEETPAEMAAEAAKPLVMPAEEKAAPAKLEATEPAMAEAEKPAEAVAPAKPKPAKKPKPAVKPKPAPAPSLVDTLLGGVMNNPYALYIGGGLGVLLLLLIAMIIRRRRQAAGGGESILAGMAPSLAGKKGEKAAAPSEESSLFSDLAISGMNSLQAEDSEVDAVTEADVYMAYGRHQQAEELLKEAIGEQPDRHELRLKLMELYYKTKDRDAFEEQAQALYTAVEGEGPLWDKAAAMGHELCPGNELFQGAAEGAEGVAAETPAEAPPEDAFDIGIDLDALAADMESLAEEGEGGEAMGEEKGEEVDIDLDLGMALGGDEAAAEPAETEEEESGMDLDFDLGALGGEEEAAAEPAAEAETPAEEKAEDEGMLDFDLGGFGAEEEAAPAEEPAAETPAESEGEEEDENLLDFDLGGFGAEEETAPVEEPAAEAPAAEAPAEEAEDENLLDFDLGDFGGAAEEEGETPSLEMAAEETAPATEEGLGEFDLGADLESGELDDSEMFADLDEIGTKLDLAKAYVDMGDSEGARSILDEVVQDGNDEQKKQAQDLLAQLS